MPHGNPQRSIVAGRITWDFHGGEDIDVSSQGLAKISGTVPHGP